jgi:hypothetical protein
VGDHDDGRWRMIEHFEDRRGNVADLHDGRFNAARLRAHQKKPETDDQEGKSRKNFLTRASHSEGLILGGFCCVFPVANCRGSLT